MKAHLGILPLLLCGLLLACSRSSSNQSEDNSPALPSADADLRRAIAAVQSDALEQDPTKRRVVVSAASDSPRDWGFQTLMTGYKESGHVDPRSDAAVAAVFDAYSRVVREQRSEALPALHVALTNPAVMKSTDPMIRYMRVRYGYAEGEKSARNIALQYLEAHDQLLASRHHPLYQYLAGYRACRAIVEADNDAHRGQRLQSTTLSLLDLVRDTNAPVRDVFEAVFDWTDLIRSRSWIETVSTNLLPYIEQNWQQHAPYNHWRGLVEVETAWLKRGSGFANTVSSEGWAAFQEHLTLAERYLNKAWQSDSRVPQTAFLMMRLELARDAESLECAHGSNERWH